MGFPNSPNLTRRIAKESFYGEMDAATPMDMMFLARALKELASADKLTAERILKVRQESIREAADKAASVAKAKGLSADTVAELRKEILGVA